MIRYFEGSEEGWIFEIIYVPAKACFSFSSKNRFMDIMAANLNSHLTDLYTDKIEVIGNRFENPEILKLIENLP